MHITQTNRFKKAIKKLHKNQKKELDDAVRYIAKNPVASEKKAGDLADIYVYKFKMQKQLTLLAYTYDDTEPMITLLALGSHENFYRDLKH